MLLVDIDETDEQSEEILDELNTVATESEGITLHTAAMQIPAAVLTVEHRRAGSRGE